MNKINQVEYCGRSIPFHEEAYEQFNRYEQELKEYFLAMEDGQEVFEDLQFRLADMLESKVNKSEPSVTTDHIDEIINAIGRPADLSSESLGDEDFVQSETKSSGHNSTESSEEKKKLYRDVNEKIIGGVASGLGNYFSMDPIAFRVLFAIFTIFTQGFGLIVYGILWVILKPKALKQNYSKRLYRNPHDKVISGVCGGLANFFGVESWIVRVIFLLPILIEAISGGLFHGASFGFFFLTYLILLFSTKETESKTEEMLSRGEGVTVNSLSEHLQQPNYSVDTNSNLNKILRIVAYLFIAFALIFMLAAFLGFSFLTVFSFPFTSAILHTPFLKWLAGLTIVFFLFLPIIAFCVWAIRRIGGVKGPNRKLRLAFGSMWGLGTTSAILLSILLVQQFNSRSERSTMTALNVTGDTLFVKSLDENYLNNGKFNTSSMFKLPYTQTPKDHRWSEVHFDKIEKSGSVKGQNPDSFYVRVEISATGNGRSGSQKNASLASYKTEFNNNSLYLAPHTVIPRTAPFRFQHAHVKLYVPEGKYIEGADEMGECFIGGKRVHFKSKKNGKGMSIRINDDEVYINEEEDGDVDISINEELEDELDYQKEALERAKAETKRNIEIEKQKLKLEMEKLKLERLLEDEE